MCSQPELDQQLKAAVCDTRLTTEASNCTLFSILLCPLKMFFRFSSEGFRLCYRDFQTRSAGLQPLCPVVLPVAPESSSLLCVPGWSSPWLPEPAAGGWVTSVSTLEGDITQLSLLLGCLQAVPGRMSHLSHLSQEEIKLLELSKSNFHDKWCPAVCTPNLSRCVSDSD